MRRAGANTGVPPGRIQVLGFSYLHIIMAYYLLCDSMLHNQGCLSVGVLQIMCMLDVQ